MSAERCQNCHTTLAGHYCHVCGEKQLTQADRRVTVLFSDFIESIYNIDNRFLRTVWYFFVKPGWLSYQYSQGVRVPYLKPISFFLIVNLVYFLVSPISDFALPLSDQYIQPYAQSIKPVIESYLVQNNTDLKTLALAYDPLVKNVAKSIVILSVPFIIPFIWLANPSKRFLLIDHSVVALYLYAFILVWPIFVTLGLNFAQYIGLPVSTISQTLPLPLFLMFSVWYAYCFFIQRNMYQSGYLAAFAKAFIVFVGIAVSHFVYRYIQFWIVWWQIT